MLEDMEKICDKVLELRNIFIVIIENTEKLKKILEKEKTQKQQVGKAFKWKKVCNSFNFVQIAYKFIKDNYPEDYKYQEFITINQLFRDMTSAKIKCIHLIHQWKKLDFELGLIIN